MPLRKGGSMTKVFFSFTMLLVIIVCSPGWSLTKDASHHLSITGVVRQPVNLTDEQLSKLEQVSLKVNEVTRDAEYRGSFHYRGVPLRTLLDLAHIEKEESGFSKRTDLAIVVRNAQNKQVVLSWGEVFYRNPAEIVVAVSSSPVMPHKTCRDCHQPEVYSRWLDQLTREVKLPKLVVSNDFYTDRSLEAITNIDVVDLHPKIPSERKEDLFSPEFSITGSVATPLTITGLGPYPRAEAFAKQAGEGKGYHGLKRFEGTPLHRLLSEAGTGQDMNTVFLISAPDGYRSLVSYGELFFSSSGRNILVADTVSGSPLKKNGKFNVIFPDDLSADRWVKAVHKIEVIQVTHHSRLSVIGVGCADTDLISLEAISAMGRADVFICSGDIAARFAKYMGNKPVLFDPLLNTEPFFGKKHPELSEEELKRRLADRRAESMQMIREALKSGNNVALLEYGDPTIFGSWIYWLRDFMDNIEIVPGLSAFNVSNALIGKHYGCNGSIVLTAPRGIREHESVLKVAAENGDTLVLFIGLREMKSLMPLFEKYYRETTPVAVVYRAGYSDSERLVRTTLRDIMNITERDEEQHLGMIYIGPCLN